MVFLRRTWYNFYLIKNDYQKLSKGFNSKSIVLKQLFYHLKHMVFRICFDFLLNKCKKLHQIKTCEDN